MPSNVVKTPKDEKLWERAKEQAKEQNKGDNYAYIMSIYKNMNPDRFKAASGLTEDLIRVANRHPRHARTIAAIVMEAGGWVPGELKDPRTWENGHVDQSPSIYQDVGSQVPPARDNQGHQLDENGNSVDSVPRTASEWDFLPKHVRASREMTLRVWVPNPRQWASRNYDHLNFDYDLGSVRGEQITIWPLDGDLTRLEHELDEMDIEWVED